MASGFLPLASPTALTPLGFPIALAISPYSGEILGKIELPHGVRVSPVVANGTLFVLTDDGILIASSSFMERWHGNSFFHCSPHALYTLCGINNLHISNFWVTSSGCYDLLRVGSIYKNKLIINFLEYFSNFVYRLLKKDDSLFKAKLISSKSFCFTANKKNYSIINSSNKLNDYGRTIKL